MMIMKGKSEKLQNSEQSQRLLCSETPEGYLIPLPLCKFSSDVWPWWSANPEVLPPWQPANPLGLSRWLETVRGETGESGEKRA